MLRKEIEKIYKEIFDVYFYWANEEFVIMFED